MLLASSKMLKLVVQQNNISTFSTLVTFGYLEAKTFLLAGKVRSAQDSGMTKMV
jgi:hypothetical protein